MTSIQCRSFILLVFLAGFVGCGEAPEGAPGPKANKSGEKKSPDGQPSDEKNSDSKRVPFDVTAASFQQDVIEASKDGLIIVDFWAPWCGPCILLEPELKAIAADAQLDVRVAKVNVDDSPALSDQYVRGGIPLMVFMKDGKPLYRIEGFVKRNAIVREIKRLQEKWK